MIRTSIIRTGPFVPFALALVAGFAAPSEHAPLGPGPSGDAAAASAASLAARVERAQEEGCLTCHAGIEEMHPGFPLSCTDCHGGDPNATTEAEAHVQTKYERRSDERVLPIDFDLAYIRFVNPTDLRVAEAVCGDCHGDLVQHLMTSLHGTTSAHLSDGFFENGLQDTRESLYAVFPTKAPEGNERKVDQLVQPPPFNPRADPTKLETHFPDLVRKECMQCHPWSQGRAVRGRVGFDGEYRGNGCASCHVEYRIDGLSESFDPTVDRVEPGHPRKHQFTTAPPTETCTTCHYGDASIGLHFRGLSQLPPGAPGGPEIEGTTDALLHRSFFIDDPAMTPPDVHHASGLHCVDCHTLQGVMGDGRMPSKMEDATEITCEACHGTFEARSTLRTERGTRLRHLFERDGSVWMRSKVTGEEHRIKQVVDVLDVAHPDYNEAATAAMTSDHGDVACYTCHGGWNVNFLGFHFYRNEALTQLDLLSGQRTPGRVTTQEKVFSTWKSFYAGLDEQGRVAPYLTGFSTMGTVDAADGTRILDQEFPVTSNGLSGLTMIHHQLHSTRPTARSCVECHRASETWGMGSANFRLGRQVAFAADRRGIEVIALDRENTQASVALSHFVQPDIVDMEVQTDPLHGFAETLFVSEGKRGIHALDATDPRRLVRRAFHATVEPRGLTVLGAHLYVADGIGGLKVFDVSEPGKLDLLATVPMFDAHEVEVRWPYAYVADGPGGLVVVDVRIPTRPRIVGGLDLDGVSAIDVDVLFQYSRPTVDEEGAPADLRTPARRLVAVLDEENGPILVDATEPAHLELVPIESDDRTVARMSRDSALYRGLVLRSHVDVASPQGGDRTVERDVLYVLEETQQGGGNFVSFLRTLDVSDPTRPRALGQVRLGSASEMLAYGAWYNPPFLAPRAFVPGEEGVAIVDLSNSAEPVAAGTLVGIENAYVFAAEAFPLDQMLDPEGHRLKDVSHPKSRWMMRGEIDAVLRVDGERLGSVGFYSQESVPVGSAARAIFARADADKSGVLTGRELRAESLRGLGELDVNGDGRVTLAEVALRAPRSDEGGGGTFAVAETPEPVMGPGGRVGRDGDLARLLDGIDPHAFDGDGNTKLDRREMRDAVFAALDLDGSGRLDVHELSRAPGEARTLRFGLGGEKASSVPRSSYRLRDEDWNSLDADGDGAVQLDTSHLADRRRRGDIPPMSEWPTRRRFNVVSLPPGITAERILAEFDSTGDGRLTKSELRRRPELFIQLDVDGSSVLEPDEIERAQVIVQQRGYGGLPDDFVTRWDLDGDGEVSRDEIPPVAFTLLSRRPPRSR